MFPDPGNEKPASLSGRGSICFIVIKRNESKVWCNEGEDPSLRLLYEGGR